VEEHAEVRQFGYRTPRIAFPISLHVELKRAGAAHPIGVRGIDISASGIAVAVSDEVPLEESVELAIRSGVEEVARIPGKVFYQSEDHFGLEFTFASDEQRRQVQQLIARFLTAV
jgi:hypothetical protein